MDTKKKYHLNVNSDLGYSYVNKDITISTKLL